MEESEDSNEIYRIAARVKNLARMEDASLTPMGESLCNLYILTLKDIYNFAETLIEPNKTVLIELLRSKENFPRSVIELNKKARKSSTNS
jgi:hypothetical protein